MIFLVVRSRKIVYQIRPMCINSSSFNMANCKTYRSGTRLKKELQIDERPLARNGNPMFSLTSMWHSHVDSLRNWINICDLKCFMRFEMNRWQQDYLGNTSNATKSWTTNDQVTMKAPSELDSRMLIILGSLSLISLPLGHTQVLTDWKYRGFLKKQYCFI